MNVIGVLNTQLVAEENPRLRELKVYRWSRSFVSFSQVAEENPRLRELKVTEVMPALYVYMPCRRRESQIKGIERPFLPFLKLAPCSLVAEENPRLRELKEQLQYLSLQEPCPLVAEENPRLRELKVSIRDDQKLALRLGRRRESQIKGIERSQQSFLCAVFDRPSQKRIPD